MPGEANGKPFLHALLIANGVSMEGSVATWFCVGLFGL